MEAEGGREALDLVAVESDNVASAVEKFWICFYHAVSIPHNRTKVKMFLSFFLFIFFHFLLDITSRKNLCKSLVIKELHRRGGPPRVTR